MRTRFRLTWPAPGRRRRRRVRIHAGEDRGAVTAEKAILTILVIAFGWAGVHFLGDPLRDQVFRVVFGLCRWIYDTIAAVFLRA